MPINLAKTSKLAKKVRSINPWSLVTDFWLDNIIFNTPPLATPTLDDIGIPRDVPVKCPTKPAPPPKPKITIIDIDVNIDNSITIIKPPPRIIYKPVEVIIDVEYPELPDRTLPDIERSPEKDITSPIKQSLANRKFGCLLANPYYVGDLNECDLNLQDKTDFLNELKQENTTIVNSLSDELTPEQELQLTPEDITNRRLADGFVLFQLPSNDKPMLFNAFLLANLLKYSEIRNYELNQYLQNSGKLHVGKINSNNCTPERSSPNILDFEFYQPTDNGIPLQLYEDNEGIKPPQLQILWRSRTQGAKKVKQMTFPNPINPNEISQQFLKQVLPSNFRFGDVLYYIELKCNFSNDQPDNLNGNAKMRIFGTGDDRNTQNTFIYTTYQQWLERLSPTTEIKGYTPILKTDTRWVDQFEGDFYPYNATWMTWDKDNKIWINVAKWYIYQKRPN